MPRARLGRSHSAKGGEGFALPMMVLGLPSLPGAGMQPRVSPVARIWVWFSALINFAFAQFSVGESEH